MKSGELRRLLHEHLDPTDLERPGWVNYSGLDVLREERNGIYVLGFNPGADDSNKQLNECELPQSSDWSAYVDVCWKRHRHQICVHDKIELVRHQKEVVGLAAELGISVQKIFATNAIFVSTNHVGQLARGEMLYLWDRCWPIHQAFLAEMRPELVVSLGNSAVSAFELLKGKAQLWQRIGEAPIVQARYRPWRAAIGTFAVRAGEPLATTIVALPHPSRPQLFGRLADNFRAYREQAPAFESVASI